MSATLVISVNHPDGALSSPYGAIVRVRQANERTVEHCLSSPGSEPVTVKAGEVTVDAVFSSGRVETRTLRLSDGEKRDVEFLAAASPHESMRWLSLTRQPEHSAAPRRPPRLSFEATPADSSLESMPPDPLRNCAVGLRARDGAPRVKIVGDARYDDCRVLRLDDHRDVAVFRARGASALALVVVESPSRPGVCRVGVLPGPWRDGAAEEIHVALRVVAEDLLPDVQMVPRDERLATVIGFLERGDQRALALLGENFVDYAVGLMSGKQRDPLAAAVGLAVLLRLGDLSRVEGWSHNLWRWFPALPDGAALHAAVMMRAPRDDAAWAAEFRSAALDAARAGSPILADSLRHLRRALLVLRDLDDGDGPVAAALAWCDRLVRASDEDAVFTTVTIESDALSTLWGAPDTLPTRSGEHRGMNEQALEKSRVGPAGVVAALEGSDATLRLVIDGKPASGGLGGEGVDGADREEATSAAGGLVIPFFGVDERGRTAHESVTTTATALRAGAAPPDLDLVRLGVMASTQSMGLPPGAAAENLDEVGWGVVWGPSVPPAVREALAPLLAHRRAEVANDDLFHEFDYVRGDGAREFLQRRSVDFGTVRPEAVPYYLLLVGDPEEIPFSFQTTLDVEYRVGRLDLPDAASYRRYAESVVATETGQATARERVLHAFGPAHPGDAPTALSVEVLVRAAEGWLDAHATQRKKHGLTSRADSGDDATRVRLLEVLRGGAGRPEVLFTAGHGMVFDAGQPRQAADQGALVTADWDGQAPVDASAMVTAADIPADADVAGLVAFVFACFGAGTPATDIFPTRAGQVLAPKPFVSALPRALLSHPKGAALGVFGHIDRTLTWSLRPPPPAPVATGPFASAALHVLVGNRLGAALDDLNQRGASLASTVASAMTASSPLDDIELVRAWTQQRDAAAFILLGDPAARLRR